MLGAKEMDSSVPVVNPSRSGAREENEKLPEAKHRDQAKQKRQKRRPTQPVSAKDVREAMEGLHNNFLSIDFGSQIVFICMLFGNGYPSLRK